MPGNIDAAKDLERARKAAAREERAKMREAQRAGFSPDGIRVILRDRKMPPDVRDAQIRTIAEYRAVAAAFDTTPLGQAAAIATVVDMPTPFSEQTVHRGRGRPRKVLFDQEHPQGTA